MSSFYFWHWRICVLMRLNKGAFGGCYKLVEIINNSGLNIIKHDYENWQIGLYALNIKKGGATDIVNKDDYLFYTYEGVNYLLGYVGKDSALTLPNDYNGQTYEIYQHAFNGRNDLTSVIISNGVTSIGPGAFINCRGLTSVTIGSGVKAIEGSAFHSCFSLRDVIILNGVESIGEYAFNSCKKLTNVTIPDSVKSIDVYAFASCNLLASVTIGSGLKEINSGAFVECFKLVEVINNSNLNIERASTDNGYLGYYALNIKKGGTSDIVNKNGYLFYTFENRNLLLGYGGNDVNLALPNDYNRQTYEIYNYAFYNNDDLESVKIDNGATSIGENAFYNCKGLTNVTIGKGVNFISPLAFAVCRNLKSVKFNNVDGWKRYKNIDSETGTEISREELSDTTSAAECLTSDYGNFYWKRG